VVNAAVVFKSRSKSKGALAVAAAIFSKWQPLYFITVSVQRIISRAIMIPGVDCPMNVDYEIHIDAATMMGDFAMLFTGVIAIASDMQAEHTPIRRRCVFGFLALCLFVDVIGSYVWGNTHFSEVSVSLGFFEVFLDNQITSSITSQAIMALHFVFVSCRSRSGRGWAYASLRFELDESGRVLLSKLSLKEMHREANCNSTPELATPAKISHLETEKNDLQSVAEKKSFAFDFLRLQQRIQGFQNRHLSLCRVFVIPCVMGYEVGGGAEFGIAMARPAFRLKYLRPLQRLADAHPKMYIGFMFCFLGLPAIAVERFVDGPERGALLLVLNSSLVIWALGYLSSKRYGLDQVAAKHVALSFRFATCVALVAGWIALNVRREPYPARIISVVMVCFFFLECALLDCSPHTPASIQICITVTAFACCAVWSIHLLTFLAVRMVYDIWVLDYWSASTGIHR
jgi:hypothetical protein